MKANEFIEKTLEAMEKEGFTRGQVDYIVKSLPERIKENDRRIEDNKPFTVFKKDKALPF